MNRKVLFMDMDGPLADFEKAIGRPEGHPLRGNWETDKVILNPMYQKGFFENLEPSKGSKHYMAKLRELEQFEIYIASNAMTDQVLYSPSEKYEWLSIHFPWLVHRVMLTCDKGLLNGDYLVDDYRQKWSPVFKGRYVWFDPRDSLKSWEGVYNYLENENNQLRINNEG